MDADGTSATFKAGVDDQQALVAADPRTFTVPAYVGKHGWVQVELARVEADVMHEIAVEAWLRTAPKRTVRAWETSRD